jgi:hypothetical protein
MRHLQGISAATCLAILSLASPAVAGDTLRAGERLYPDQAIGSGSTVLLYQADNNLVLYQSGSPIWATMAGLGYPTDRFEMQTDCNAVVYSGYGYVWASWTNGQGSSCYARVIEGDWFICSGTTRVFSARGGGDCSGGGVPAGYVGCFTDDWNRALPAFQGGGFGIQACVDTCRNQGYAYAGSQYYDQCFCGNALGYSQVSDAECNTPCNSGGGYCGGAWRNSIYATGASPPCGNGMCQAGEDCNNCPADCGTCPPGGGGAMLRQGESLYPGQCRTSPNGQVRLCLQADGNLVAQQNGVTIWAANTAGWPGWATLQGNGSLVVYNGGGSPVWETGDASTDLRGPAALLVLDEGDVAIDQEDNLEAAPPPANGDCEIEIYSRTAAGSGVGIHDVMRINYGDGRVDIKSMQDNADGCGGVTCNDAGVGDGCPAAPEKDARDPFHDTQKTWSRRMPRNACAACAAAYDRTIGYSYRIGDSNGAVNDCMRDAQANGMLGKRPSLVRLLHSAVPSLRLGREYQFAAQGGKSPQGACTYAISQYGCAGLAQSPCPNVCGQAAGDRKLCTWCPSAPGCDQGCTPSTSCSQQGAQCGSVWNGCEQESCPSYCGPYQDCADNRCCTHAQGNCDWAYDECAQQYTYLGSCFFDEVCVNNWCESNPCTYDPCCCGDGRCQFEWYDWCVSHGYDHQCCQYIPYYPLQSPSPEEAVCTGGQSSAARR